MKRGTGFNRLEVFILVAAAIYLGVTDNVARTYWPFMVSAYVMAALVYMWESRTLVPAGLRGHLFPKSVWLHESAIHDCLLFLVNSWIVYAISVWAVSSGTTLFFQAEYIEGLLLKLDSTPKTPAAPAGALALGVYTVAVVVIGELFYYISHRLTHEIPALWEFHKVHHSAKVLTPLTLYRVHLVNAWLDAGLSAVGTGLVSLVFLHFYPGTENVIQILGINAFLIFFYLVGANLRHSHIWISYGPVLEHLFQSPALHQIHHSENPAHFNKNYGSHLAIWDWMFGTLYVPKGREQLTFGLGSAAAEAPYSTVWGMFIHPVTALFKPRKKTR